MPAYEQIMLWGAAVGFPVILNLAMRQSPDALGLSGMLVIIWAFGRAMWVVWSPPECLALNPLIDSIAGATVFSAWVTRPRFWKFALGALFVAQVCLHLDFWLSWPQNASLYRYILLNNTLFAGQLACVLWPGGSSVARSTGAWLSGLAHPIRHAGH
jgi:hypothetical protein